MNRRMFLGTGIATAAVTMAGSARATIAPRRDAVVVFDTRFEAARRFAAEAEAQQGLRTFGFAGDATTLWHDCLAKALNNGQAVIGLTAGGARFCLQLMASPGIRCIHHVTHSAPTLTSQHVCWTGEKSVDQELRCAPSWPEHAALVAIKKAFRTQGGPVDPVVSGRYPTHQLPDEDHLESWVFAPAAAAMRGGARLFSEWNR
ncbi:hypothetical protein [Sphingorhabdus lacus]|uniref:Uncharacterized protein n=1 Tax=Sphingorhabdus lacus TaxID=392610 RepID=A0A6I6L436_9SPHN|nr:hypothetical protein [Sphingorhabdus lacus]QGY79274.1 hypothetical protein EUU25_00745 [Sphingorhabdus lacus]